ncbi:MAG TPA: enoyl-CoA hydratase/isomerase family protein [Phycisphaerales bacterium]|nr:enoyl-CoA hydratase/isomerase family protein [Phycisphaerales bacterium]
MPDLTTLTTAGRTATLTLSRPDARNALSIDLLGALHAQADVLAKRDDISVLVLTGAGKSFCAGMDLKAVLDDPAAPRRLLHLLADFTLKLRALPMVTVAKVNGAAIGGGCGLSCVCDLAVTHADSKMGYPEVDLGVCPAVVAPWLVRKIGAGPARRVLLMGGLMTGREAFDLGMVDHVVPTAADLDAACDVLTQRLAKGGPHALRATKDLLNTIDASTDPTLVKRGADLSADVVAMPQTQHMLRAKFQ